MADVIAQCAQSWAGLSDKLKYETKATEDKKKYDEKLVEYKQSMQKLKEKDPPTQVIESDDSLSEEYQKKLNNQSEKIKPRLKKVYERKDITTNFQANEMLDRVYKRSRQFSEDFQNDQLNDLRGNDQILIPGQLPNDTLNKIKNGLGAEHHQIRAAERQADILDDPLNMDRMDEGPGQGFGDPGLGAAGSEGIFNEAPSRSGFEVYEKEKSIDRIELNQDG